MRCAGSSAGRRATATEMFPVDGCDESTGTVKDPHWTCGASAHWVQAMLNPGDAASVRSRRRAGRGDDGGAQCCRCQNAGVQTRDAPVVRGLTVCLHEPLRSGDGAGMSTRVSSSGRAGCGGPPCSRWGARPARRAGASSSRPAVSSRADRSTARIKVAPRSTAAHPPRTPPGGGRSDQPCCHPAVRSSGCHGGGDRVRFQSQS